MLDADLAPGKNDDPTLVNDWLLRRVRFQSIQRVLLRDAWDSLRGEHHFGGFSGVNTLWKPRWYES